MATFASQMAQDVNSMNQELQNTISTMGQVSEGVRTFLNLAKQAAVIPQASTRDVIGPGGVSEVSTTPNPPPPFDVPTISSSRVNTKSIVNAINNLGSKLIGSSTSGGGASVRVLGGY